MAHIFDKYAFLSRSHWCDEFDHLLIVRIDDNKWSHFATELEFDIIGAERFDGLGNEKGVEGDFKSFTLVLEILNAFSARSHLLAG